VSPNVEIESLQRGQSLRLNEALTVVEAGGFESSGEVCALREVLRPEKQDGPQRALVVGHADEERVVWLADPLAEQELKAGDSLLVDSKAGCAYEQVPKAEVEDLELEEVPDIGYEDIGGLSRQTEGMKEAGGRPLLHGAGYRECDVVPPEGAVLDRGRRRGGDSAV